MVYDQPLILYEEGYGLSAATKLGTQEIRWSFSYCILVCNEKSFFLEKTKLYNCHLVVKKVAFVGNSTFFYKKD